MSTIFFLIMRKGNLNLMNEWKKKSLLDLAFCISLARKILDLLGKSQETWKRNVCGNHVKMLPPKGDCVAYFSTACFRFCCSHGEHKSLL